MRIIGTYAITKSWRPDPTEEQPQPSTFVTLQEVGGEQSQLEVITPESIPASLQLEKMELDFEVRFFATKKGAVKFSTERLLPNGKSGK
jgi:hypothetical protein